ncbi:polysaccharide pyruvyl transferase family protein [Actinacidiphila oryziradicis]|uniref:polysaccharide pyruvyl transferase family protein n=1 Tax=Actinacidiphila oryziradicis TaxID=2571141 RepID=UPI0023F1203B|nr:polysaccharide pyruvyl transferase family protein [Actinacidiphila oryziradicis]MCW2869010.1 Polysaccharide pyruvyl transferase [Actinacidiphila oryziradicis]
MPATTRVLLTGWFSFLEGEATAGDVLAAEAVRHALQRASVPYETAWSPMFRPDALHLDAADPADYTHLVFVCGPVHSTPGRADGPAPLLDLHRRFAQCRRIAVGVSVPDPADPAATGFDVLLPRDGPGLAGATPDLSLRAPLPPRVPLVGVILTEGQHEYGARRHHAQVARILGDWLRGLEAARIPLDTRLDTRDWQLPATPGQLYSMVCRLDAVVTTRLHGLVLALRAGVPALAIDPVRGGAKVTAQGAALGWPAVLPAEGAAPAALDHWLAWCLSPSGRGLARAASGLPHRDPLADLIGHLQ